MARAWIGNDMDLLKSDGARTGLFFGATSGVITTIGLIVGLNSGTSSVTAVMGGIMVIAVADSMLGWTYAIAGIGLVADTAWGYVWAWLPAVVLTYHALSFWMWTGNQRRAGHTTSSTKSPFRVVWTLANLLTGLLALLVAWNGT